MSTNLDLVGARLAGLRASRGWSLEELARRCGLTRSYLSKLERGVSQPSIATLSKLSQVYGQGVGELLGETVSPDGLRLFRKSTTARSRTELLLGAGAVDHSLLDLYLLRPGAPGVQPRAQRHPGEEAIFVLSGRVRLTVAGQAHDLSRGEGAWYRAELPHDIQARGRGVAEVLVVAARHPVR